ncbi:MMPL family transporter [Leekyejoonella antrihumi]|uniref:MMPL family transporter n=1 Tax=Leekyejoonella antrihumi TaxID=1660198 RepID=UPI001FE8B756|nr:MMPL family transporter [Leekyejoonella antrihumi]
MPIVLVVLWLVVGSVAGPFAGKLGTVAINDPSAFLPTTAEATRVANLQKTFQEKEINPAVVVYQRDAGITAADRAAVGKIKDAVSLGKSISGPVVGPLPSKDGEALELIVPLNGTLEHQLPAVVDQLRRNTSAGLPPGLQVYLTGPAGFAADLTSAFGGIHGVLLVVAVSVVILILLVVYRSPILPFVVLVSALFALALASGVVYWLTKQGVITLNGQSQGILSILVVGAATDYALLLTSRFREELREHESRFRAMQVALRQSLAPILASGITVILSLLCLLFSNLRSTSSLGPVAAIGIAGSLASALTFLPAVLVLLGRAGFWPRRPEYGSPHPEKTGVWGRVAGEVGRRPRLLWVVATGVLIVFAAFLPTLKASGVSQSALFLNNAESVTGQKVAAEHFPAGLGSPVVVIGPAEAARQMVRTAAGVQGISSATLLGDGGQQIAGDAKPKVVDGRVEVQAVLKAAPDSDAAVAVVKRMRVVEHAKAPGSSVGGATAVQLDTQRTGERDRSVIIPIVLAVVLVLLMLLLRAVLAPVLLLVSVVLSFAATLGASALVFNHVLGFPGADPSVPLFGFVFLVALGIDYNIFLMTRVREESVRHGTRAGVRRGLAVTGGVITSAGVVLAATFSALSVIPILFLAQIAFIVAFGVLLDTLLVRSVLVPALAHDIGPAIWWPSRLARTPEDESESAT